MMKFCGIVVLGIAVLSICAATRVFGGGGTTVTVEGSTVTITVPRLDSRARSATLVAPVRGSWQILDYLA